MAHRPSTRLLFLIGVIVFFLLSVTYFRREAAPGPEHVAPDRTEKTAPVVITNEMLEGDVVMPMLGNATVK